MMRRVGRALHGDRLACICLLFLLLVLVAGILAPWLAPHDPLLVSWRDKFQPPGWRYPFGADALGRCIFSRLLFGIRTTVGMALLAMSLTLLVGTMAGVLAGFFRGRVDALLMRLCDLMLAFPAEVMIFALVGMLGPGLGNILLAVLLAKWAWYARMVRGIVMQYSGGGYVQYARLIGATPRYVILRHLLPVAAAELVLLATADSGAVILLLSALSFLGLGVQPPTPEWGVMLGDARNVMLAYPWQMLPAGCAVMLVVAAFNYLGDFFRDVLDVVRAPGGNAAA
ncbi:nickel/cobalt ABC transporter permease [Musicola keenii]|uniref:nickel/cobalt ABC transporter permease n=1 Tax=Musicola keenii TaxID=2884250 RepID=UPI00177DED65|nr:nickel/cobalt ABC transporter permease [Musicola keenii]